VSAIVGVYTTQRNSIHQRQSYFSLNNRRV